MSKPRPGDDVVFDDHSRRQIIDVASRVGGLYRNQALWTVQVEPSDEIRQTKYVVYRVHGLDQSGRRGFTPLPVSVIQKMSPKELDDEILIAAFGEPRKSQWAGIKTGLILVVAIIAILIVSMPWLIEELLTYL